MKPRAPLFGAVILAGCVIASAAAARPQVNPPAPPATNPPVTSSPSPSPPPGAPAATPIPGMPFTPAPSPSPTPTATPTPAPIVVQPAAAMVPVGASQVLHVSSVYGQLSVNVVNPAIVDAAVDQTAQTITLTGKAPGATAIGVTDQRNMPAIVVPVRVAYNAGTIADTASIRITGDPASPQFVKERAVAAAVSLAQARSGAQIVATADQVRFSAPLAQDDIATLDVPVLIQGEQYFSVDGVTHVRVENMAAPKITPDSLTVSDYPEKLTENGVLFASDLKRTAPTRFLYFHYNPPGEPDRRIVLRAQNRSSEPAVVQFITGAGGPDPNEMLAGHTATYTFLKRLVQNEGQVIVIPGNGTLNLVEQPLPAKNVVCNLLQLRVLSGSTVHLTLFAQNASSSPDEALSSTELLEGDHPHARGEYKIPEFHYSTLWNTTDQYLELQLGHIPLPNLMQGQALAGDYGVLQSFVIKVQNPTNRPQPIAIYENPRGGRATGTYLIDGVLIQSHQVPPFSRYKVRQYVVPARGFVRVTIETIPDSGSSYPLRLIFAPDDGSVAPGAPGSPIY
ncbi:MAG TPA: pilus assembly protein N-terminal domain-containing protein [Candidatus Baltobacteraceae bacterium]|nr:pilus assembly protein N-terminal domain-containing protein [Candidatus Baltobacteraceae bacterium]